jgi:hypothetical protein
MLEYSTYTPSKQNGCFAEIDHNWARYTVNAHIVPGDSLSQNTRKEISAAPAAACWIESAPVTRPAPVLPERFDPATLHWAFSKAICIRVYKIVSLEDAKRAESHSRYLDALHTVDHGHVPRFVTSLLVLTHLADRWDPMITRWAAPDAQISRWAQYIRDGEEFTNISHWGGSAK